MKSVGLLALTQQLICILGDNFVGLDDLISSLPGINQLPLSKLANNQFKGIQIRSLCKAIILSTENAENHRKPSCRMLGRNRIKLCSSAETVVVINAYAPSIYKRFNCPVISLLLDVFETA